VLFDSNVVAIHADRVDVDVAGRGYTVANDAVIICAGGVLPGAFLRQIGVQVETKFGKA
jgi:thioredoxin reductase (NADPH)